MGNAIFDDLEIDYSDMLTNPQGFAERVYEAADKLKAICKADTSIRSFEEKYKSEGITIPKELNDILNNFYDEVDVEDLNIMVDAIKMAKKLVTDLETSFRDRCIRQAAKEGTAIGNKRVAHAQYTRLREDFNLYAKAFKVFTLNQGEDLKQLPALPGNYGAGTSSLIHHVFYLGEDEYRNHYAVCRKLGIELRPLMDFLEYLENNETGVIVKEVQ